MADPSFERLDPEKKLRIIEGAMHEFAEYGYSEASTNRIVKRVGIAKGSLFNYFNSKDDLYLYVAEFTLKQVIPLIKRKMETMPGDIIERLKLMTEAVIDIYIHNPLYYSFFMGVLEQGAHHLQQQLLQRNAEIISILDFFNGVDTSQFRFDSESTFLLIKWLYTGIKQEIFEIKEVQKDPEQLKTQFVKRVKTVVAMEKIVLVINIKRRWS